MRKSFKDLELKTLPDPHHNGFWHWGWDGENLWIKAQINKKYWTQVKRIKATPNRIGVIMKLTGGKGLNNLKFKTGSQFFNYTLELIMKNNLYINQVTSCEEFEDGEWYWVKDKILCLGS